MTADLLQVSPGDIGHRFDRGAFRVRHRLAEDARASALFDIERLVELAGQLPANQIEYNAGELPVDCDPGATPGNGLSAAETIRRIRDCKSWLVLKRVEAHPEYRSLLDRCLDEIDGVIAPSWPGMRRREGFVFVSSPGSVTPFHLDPEVNFLLQVHGRKTMHVWRRADDEVVGERDLERYFSSDAHRNLPYRDAFEARGERFELAPGDGVHVPMAAPHWVQNGDDVSVSFSITFRTDASERRERLYQVNARLRGLGLRPQPVGRRPRLDDLKLGAYDLLAKARRTLRPPHEP